MANKMTRQDRLRQIEELLLERPEGMTTRQIADCIGITPSTYLRRMLNEIEREGIIYASSCWYRKMRRWITHWRHIEYDTRIELPW